jgi:hypothetical protein
MGKAGGDRKIARRQRLASKTFTLRVVLGFSSHDVNVYFTGKTTVRSARRIRPQMFGRERPNDRGVESVPVKQLPDILTSATFWASIATMWAAAGAWFTYVAASLTSRQQTYEGILILIEGLEAELALVSIWAAGDEGNQGYVSKTRAQLRKEHLDWFNPSRSVFKFSTPVLNNVTNSPYAKFLTPVIRPLVMLNHSIRRLFENIERYQAFVFGDIARYQSVLPKFAVNPPNLGASTTPTSIVLLDPSQIGLTEEEQVYVNHIFMMNEWIHQTTIGGATSEDEFCLYKAFRTAQRGLQDFKSGLKREPLPRWFWLLHILAGLLAWVGLWELVRWFGVWQGLARCIGLGGF